MTGRPRTAGDVLARGARNVRLAFGCVVLLLVAILLAGSLATLVTIPAERPTVAEAGAADYSRRRFYYDVETDRTGRPARVHLIEYFPVRRADGLVRPVGRVLATSDDAADRSLHEDERFARPAAVVDIEVRGVLEPTPDSILDELRATTEGEVLAEALVAGRPATGQAIGRTRLVAVVGLAVAVGVALLLRRFLWRTIRGGP